MTEQVRNNATGDSDQPVPMSWLDRQFVNASGCGIVALALLFNGAAALLGLIV